MGSAKLFFLALCLMQTSSSVANEDPENCSALPAYDAQGQRVLLQHSELRHSVASLHTQTNKDPLGYTLLGYGQCVDTDGNLHHLGWSSCTCGQPTGSVCTTATCVSVEVCAADCNAEPRCRAFNYHSGHCWLYGDAVESVAVNTAFDWYQCFAKGPTTTSTTSTTTTTTTTAAPPTVTTVIKMTDVAFLGADSKLAAKEAALQFIVPDDQCSEAAPPAPPSSCLPKATVIRLATDTSKCLTMPGCSPSGSLIVQDCLNPSICDQWNVYPSWIESGDRFRRAHITWAKDSTKCLGLQGRGGMAQSSVGSPVLLEDCDVENPFAWEQQWTLRPDFRMPAV